MKSRVTVILLILLIACTAALSSPRTRTDHRNANRDSTKIERKLGVDAQVSISVCVASGNIKVNGWDKNEVRARSVEAADIVMKRRDEGTDAAKKISIKVVDEEHENSTDDPCDAFSELELDVPRGATVQVQTRDSDIDVSDVGVVYAQTQNGDISIERAHKIVDASSIGGGISLKESKGRISLHTAGGAIDASDVQPSDIGDTFDVKSLGGEITLDHVTHPQLTASSLSGSLCITGPLASGGHYNFRTLSGNMTLTMPENSSFQVSARLSMSAEIVTDFPITLISQSTGMAIPIPHPAGANKPAQPPPSVPKVADPPIVVKVQPEVVAKIKTRRGDIEVAGMSRRLEAIHGSGDAKLELASFSGTIRLQKQ